MAANPKMAAPAIPELPGLCESSDDNSDIAPYSTAPNAAHAIR